ncbi:CheA signal transduction histidine kinase [Thermaerobacter marianensis DSM 12885]|uniref:Chemotaxis protein CheA n=1 Tax=Thermaerobacter marianensis (strain ATCC 700841 / DSM 12885 / JCM 10246 / 7p75a) TaxID=644966 RepID=E6SIG1_THEM7|nr:chemotaxis protein CheA [Thermaerobacter marianensis]ADU51972.1 CheA signal transduction histidine kinase [Thermaerobacter marianensis DSM 12885]
MKGVVELGDEELRLFITETEELLDELEDHLLALEGGHSDPERIDQIFRAAHTIKGSAATAGFEGIAKLTHAMENLFDAMRGGRLVPGPAEVKLLLDAVDTVRGQLAEAAEGRAPGNPPAELLAAIEAIAGGAAGGASGAGPGERAVHSALPPANASWRIDVAFDSDCPMPAVRALQVLLALEPLGEIVASDPSRELIEAEKVGRSLQVWLRTGADRDAVLAALRHVPELVRVTIQQARSASATPTGTATRQVEDRSIRIDVELLDRLMNLVGELVIDRGRLSRVGERLGERPGVHDLAEELSQVTTHLGRVTGTLQEVVLKARMLPIARVFRRIPRLVHDLAAQLGKEVELELVGEDTELDRSLLEVIADPLVHLVRNALDHGIEPPEERIKAGKPRPGRLRLVAGHEGNHVVVRIEDDGRGIDPDRIRAAAIRKGLVSRERAAELSDREALELLFAPGFSTAETVTDISGRGVGLDVVRQNIEGSGGRVEVESTPGRGTTFALILPLTLTTIRALLVRVGADTYALPLGSVAEVLHVRPDQVSSVHTGWATIVRGRVVPLLFLRRYAQPQLTLPRPEGVLLAVLVHHQSMQVGLVVDRLLGEQEIVVKGLPRLFAGVRGMSGVTILGDGGLALILDVPGLIALLADEGRRHRVQRAGQGSRIGAPHEFVTSAEVVA